jgi:hypothetical protein
VPASFPSGSCGPVVATPFITNLWNPGQPVKCRHHSQIGAVLQPAARFPAFDQDGEPSLDRS